MAIELKTQIRNGKMFYIIGSNDISKEHIVVVNTIAERNSLIVDGFVFVKNAATGSPHDPSVHRGWAMYFSLSVEGKIKWIKVAEEESVDGIWGANEEYLRQFVQRSELTVLLAKQLRKNKIYDAYVKKLDDFKFHEHDNLDILQLVSSKGGFPTFKVYTGYTEDSHWNKIPQYAEIPMQSVIYYSAKTEDSLQWRNPCNPDVDAIDVATSTIIADKFVTTEIAYPGMILRVEELNGMVTDYMVVKNGDSLGWKLIAYHGGSSVTYVDCLPVPDVLLVDKGFFYLMSPAKCGHRVNTFYKCIKVGDDYEWVSDDLDLTVSGSKITTCYRTSWNTVRITYEDPERVQTIDDSIVEWCKTTVVRKFGAPPIDANDGVVVKVSTNHNQFKTNGLIDVFPWTDLPVYYGVFAESASGAKYNSEDNAVAAEYVSWQMINSFIKEGLVEASGLGIFVDSIILPYNSIVDAKLEATIVVYQGVIELFCRDVPYRGDLIGAFDDGLFKNMIKSIEKWVDDEYSIRIILKSVD